MKTMNQYGAGASLKKSCLPKQQRRSLVDSRNLSMVAALGLVAATISLATAEEVPTVKPLSCAHAHNDYRHARPLWDALDHGFCSVEADIYLVDGQLLVGHDRHELRPERTLQELYLDPLRERVRKNGGRVYRDGPSLLLLIDIKSNGAETYSVLRDMLSSYAPMLSRVEQGKPIPGAVEIVISGDRAQELIAADNPRYAGIDGRLTDLGSQSPAHLMPLISDRWTSHFRWRGRGVMPAEERQKLRAIVRKCHSAGRRVRFWATPELPAVWEELLAAGVDYINTDRLEEMREFLLHRSSTANDAAPLENAD
jgi:hypothetical protein